MLVPWEEFWGSCNAPGDMADKHNKLFIYFINSFTLCIRNVNIVKSCLVIETGACILKRVCVWGGKSLRQRRGEILFNEYEKVHV
jgi:hypothetical protein